MPEGDWLTVRQAAKALGVTVNRVNQLVRAGLLAAETVEGKRFVSAAAVEGRRESVRRGGGVAFHRPGCACVACAWAMPGVTRQRGADGRFLRGGAGE